MTALWTKRSVALRRGAPATPYQMKSNGGNPYPACDYAGSWYCSDKAGREVWGRGEGFSMTRDGAHAKYVLAPVDELTEKPANLSMEQASAVCVPHVVAWRSSD